MAMIGGPFKDKERKRKEVSNYVVQLQNVDKVISFIVENQEQLKKLDQTQQMEILKKIEEHYKNLEERQQAYFQTILSHNDLRVNNELRNNKFKNYKI